MPKRKRSNTYPIASQSFQPVKRARLSRDGTGNTKTHEPDPTSLHGSVHLKQKDLPNGKEGRNVYRLSSPSPSVAYALDEQNSLNYTNKKPDRQQGTSQHAYERKAAENTLGLHTMDIPRPKDADRLIRRCDFPAMLDNDLRRLMFPSSTSEDFEEEILWNIESLADSLADPDQNFRQIRNHNGEVLGFACWSIFNTKLTIDFVPHQRDKGHGNKSQGSKATRLPSSLDQQTWRSVSRKLAVERRRVLEGIDRVWRLTMMSVTPQHQGQGIGSLLMQWGCAKADNKGLDCFVMASPVAVRLYRKFGFKEIGKVEYQNACFTSMLRKARPLDRYPYSVDC